MQEIKEFFKAIKGDKYFHPFPFNDESKEMMSNAKKDMYMFYLNKGKITGMYMLRGWDEGYEIPSFGMIVHPRHRGKGIGTAMLEEAIKICKKKKCKKIRLTADKDNVIARKMYIKAGFKFNKNIGFKTL